MKTYLTSLGLTLKLTVNAVFILGLLAAHNTLADSPKSIYKATYKGKHSGLSVTTTRSLYYLGNDIFKIDTQAKALFASIDESTVFELKEMQIKPKSYDYTRKVFGKKKQQSLQFDWSNKTVSGIKNGKPHTTTLPLTEYSLDETTFQLQLQRDAVNTTKQKAFTYSYIKPFKQKDYTFYPQGQVDFNFNGKDTLAILMSTQPRTTTTTQNSNKTIHVWLLPAYNHIIGKIEFIDENDDSYALTLTHYTFNPALIHLVAP